MNAVEVLFIFVFIRHVSSQTDIRLPPTITKRESKNVVFRVGDDVTLDCAGHGIPEVTYQWKRNGVDMNANSPYIKRGANGAITISAAELVRDEGFYQCLVSNQYGTASSDMTHVQGAFFHSSPNMSVDVRENVKEGEPLHIRSHQVRSFPRSNFGWEVAADAAGTASEVLNTTKRIHMDENGDLYFAYALPEDDLGGRCYIPTTSNPYLDVKSKGNCTRITVTRVPAGINRSEPVLAFSSPPVTLALIGESVALRCGFSGYPDIHQYWSGPGKTLPIGRYTLNKFNSEILINNIKKYDYGEYVCTGINQMGSRRHTLQLRVEGAPRFLSMTDRPHDVNVTDGDTVTISCNADAIPAPDIVWFQNEKILDVSYPPKRFLFSNDSRTLTIVDTCRTCDDPERFTDLSVIQCNASNIHGYAFASGYLNVLAKTQIIPSDTLNVTVGIREERGFDFECHAISDPSTSPTVRWYKMIDGELHRIYEEPPEVTLKTTNGGSSITLSIYVKPKSTEWKKFQGEFRCVASNGYSKATRSVALTVDGSKTNQASYIGPWCLYFFLIIALTVAYVTDNRWPLHND